MRVTAIIQLLSRHLPPRLWTTTGSPKSKRTSSLSSRLSWCPSWRWTSSLFGSLGCRVCGTTWWDSPTTAGHWNTKKRTTPLAFGLTIVNCENILQRKTDWCFAYTQKQTRDGLIDGFLIETYKKQTDLKLMSGLNQRWITPKKKEMISEKRRRSVEAEQLNKAQAKKQDESQFKLHKNKSQQKKKTN